MQHERLPLRDCKRVCAKTKECVRDRQMFVVKTKKNLVLETQHIKSLPPGERKGVRVRE